MLKPDIWAGLHAERWDPVGKHERAKSQGTRAFVDPEGYRLWVAGERTRFEDEITRQRP